MRFSLLKNTPNYSYALSYLSIRKTIGCIAIAIPIVLPLYNYLTNFVGLTITPYNFTCRQAIWQDSISHHFHTPARDLFVGALCAVALFMFFYKGLDNIDNWLANAVGICALGVAFFPTPTCGVDDWVGYVHIASGGSFLHYWVFFRSGVLPKAIMLTSNFYLAKKAGIYFTSLRGFPFLFV